MSRVEAGAPGRPRRTRRKRVLDVLRIGFLVVVLVAVGIALWSNWEEVQGDLGRLGPVTILGAVVLSLLSPFFTVLGWRVLLADRGWTTQGPDDLWQQTTVEEIAEYLDSTVDEVLEVLLGSHKPLGAYEIMDRAAAGGGRPAPITIYRALDFLRDNGLVHRIESRNAFVACVNNHAAGDLVVFLICEHCGAVGEAQSAAVADQLRSAARAAGFAPKAPVIEISGVCAHCQQHEHT